MFRDSDERFKLRTLLYNLYYTHLHTNMMLMQCFSKRLYSVTPRVLQSSSSSSSSEDEEEDEDDDDEEESSDDDQSYSSTFDLDEESIKLIKKVEKMT